MSSPPSQYFIALLPPPAVQAYATDLKTDCRDRYQTEAALRSPPHITLYPPFAWPSARRADLFAALAGFVAPHPQIPIEISGFGAFPPRVIYLAVTPTAELMALQAALSQHLAETRQLQPPRSRRRPFRPHLTIAFRDLTPAAFRRAWPDFERRSVQFQFSVQTFTLLRHTGKDWQVDQDWPLTTQ